MSQLPAPPDPRYQVGQFHVAEPYPLRFRTAEDGLEFQKSYEARKPDASKAVPPIIPCNGGWMLNPDYEAANFEWTIVEIPTTRRERRQQKRRRY